MLFQTIILATIALFIGISNSAGIGGGSIINVLLITGLDYTAKESITLSYIFLMGGGLAATITGINKFTPSGKRFIDFDLVLLTLPMMLSGAILGVMVNHLISELIITIIFIILIVNVMQTSYERLKENKQPQIKRMKEEIELKQIMLHPAQNHQNRLAKSELLQNQDALIPKDTLIALGKVFAYTIIIVLCRGGKTFDSVIGVERCGTGSFILLFLHLICSYLFYRSIANNQIFRQKQKERYGFVFENQDDKMSYTKLYKGMFNGFIAGVLGATVAIGGGLVLVPIWLKAGIQKDIVTNSTAPLILFSSSISFIISALLGQYNSVWQILMYLCLSFCGSYLVKKLIIYLTEKYGLNKLVYILLLILMTLSLLVFLPLQYYKYEDDREQFLEFGSFC